MKRLNLFFFAAIATVAVSCNNEPDVVDYPIVGDFTLYGENASGAWKADEQVGVFVTSDGVMQSNLLYTSAEGEGAVALTAKNEAAGFKLGEHMIYAYTPYVENVAELTAVSMPDLAIQDVTTALLPDWALDLEETYWPMFEYMATSVSSFQSASLTQSEYSSAAVTLKFEEAVPLKYLQFSEISFTGDADSDINGKKITKIVVSSESVLGYTNGVFDMEKNEATYDEVKSLTLNTDMTIATNALSPTGKAFTFATTLSEEETATTVFNIEVYLEDGTKYVTPEDGYKMTDWGTFAAVEVSLAE